MKECYASKNTIIEEVQCNYVEDWAELIEEARREQYEICSYSAGRGCTHTCRVTPDSPERLDF